MKNKQEDNLERLVFKKGLMLNMVFNNRTFLQSIYSIIKIALSPKIKNNLKEYSSCNTDHDKL